MIDSTAYSSRDMSDASGIFRQRRSVIELSADPRRNEEIRAAVEEQLRAIDDDSEAMIISKRFRVSQNVATSREADDTRCA